MKYLLITPSLTLLCRYFSSHLPCCALNFSLRLPTVPFVFTYPAVALFSLQALQSGRELGSVNSNLEQHARQDHRVRITQGNRCNGCQGAQAPALGMSP